MTDSPQMTSDLTALIVQVCERLPASLPFAYAGLVLPDRARLHLVLPNQASLPILQGPAPEAIRSHATQIARDLPAQEVPLAEDNRPQSQLAAPLIVGNRVLGALVLGTTDPAGYTDQQRELFGLVTAQAALSVAACTTPQPSIRRTVELQLQQAAVLQRIAVITSATLDSDEMLVTTVHEAAALLNVQGALLMTLATTGRQLEVHAPSVWGFGDRARFPVWPIDGYGHIIHAYHTGQPYLSNTTIGDPLLETLQVGGIPLSTVLTIPLNTRNRTVGTLTLLNKIAPDGFGSNDLELAQIIGGQIAVSLESTQLFAAERKRADRLALVNEISQALSSVLDHEILLEQTVHNIQTLLGYESVSLLLVDPTRQYVRLMAQATSNSDLAAPPDFTFSLEQGVVGRAIQTQEVQYIADTHESGDFYAPDEKLSQAAASSLTIPLRSVDQVLGALDIVSTTANSFTESDRNIMQTLAAHVTTAIENARLFRQARRQIEDQRFLRDATIMLSRTIMMPDLLTLAARMAESALNGQGACVALRLNNGQFQHAVSPDSLPDLRYLCPDLHPPFERYPALLDALYRQQTLRLEPGAIESPELHEMHLLVPVMQRQTYIGLIEVIFTDPAHHPDESDLRLVEALAQQTGIAAEIVNLIEELEERARELSEANRLKNEFLARISHELRTPMNSIIGFSETLISGLYGELGDAAQDRLERILRNGRMLLVLIDDLLDLSRIEADRLDLRLRPVSLLETVRAATEATENQFLAKGLRVTLAEPPDLPDVLADAVRLRQIINNLLSNALKFTHQGGITIELGTHAGQSGQQVWCSITDTGIGISAADQTIIFDEFRQADGTATREYGGTGLGLTISRKLLDMMHGTITVESQPGIGSTFTIHLPAAAYGSFSHLME